jgi:micrococcal nuclease
MKTRAMGLVPVSARSPHRDHPPTMPLQGAHGARQQTTTNLRRSMTTFPYRVDRPHRPTIALLVALVVLFVLGPAAGIATAQEDTSGPENSLKTVPQESTSAGSPSGKSVAPGDAKVGVGEAVARDAYAGNGCARAGDVTAGDCDEKPPSGDSDNGPPNNPGRPEDDEETTETTASETTVFEITSEETTLLEDTTEGETTNTASPVPDETDLCPAGPPKGAVEATIEDATDGDTVELAEEVDGHDTVRLIGVDTPELEGGDGQTEPLAEEASDFATEQLEGQEVLLQGGEEKADEYGRLLAYVWTVPDGGVLGGLKRMVGMGEAELFNLKLLEEGHAEVLTIEPNDLYAECFEAAERDAREAGVGIRDDNKPSDDPAETQYEETAPQTTTANFPPPDAAPVENTPEAAPTPEEDPARETSERQTSPTEAQYEQSPRSSPEIQEEEIQESVAPSGGTETAVLETPSGPEPSASPAASVGASASPKPAADLPAEAAPTATVSVLPETGGPSLLFSSFSLGVAGLLGGTATGLLALRVFLKRAHADGR